MQQKLLRSAHYIELGGYQYWPVLLPRGIRLYTYEQIPVFLRDNPYITDGYRAYLPSRLCLRSLFILSNESVNIWSHLLGFLLFFTLGIRDLTVVLPAARASREDFVICAVCLFCFQVCMLCSVGYHLFCCHRSEKTSRRWMALDYAGISIGILGCYVSGVFYAFYCSKYWRQVYLITVLAMILAVFFVQIHPNYLTQQWRRLRSIIFCSVSGYGIIPTIHWVSLNGGIGAAIVQDADLAWSRATAEFGRAALIINAVFRQGVCSTCGCHVFHCCSSISLLYFQSSRKVLSRTAQLPRL
ncbi:progestin and adipoQ receptor family member 3 isoform X2 [Meleagris gallopavo]|uniref:Progestin and adipoQ receptor family member 3 n=1 Tax=Meleagris gallopavo TaxID=9103 RepID=G1N5X6_MELGA|nr:progestin and adipoQ receptor family member 3 isoform X2 [Meleagris gallopavo]